MISSHSEEKGVAILFLPGADLRGKPPAQIWPGIHPLEAVSDPGADVVGLAASRSDVMPDFIIYEVLLIINIGFTISSM